MHKSRESVQASRGGYRKRYYKLGLTELERFGDEDNDPLPDAFVANWQAPKHAHGFKLYSPYGVPAKVMKRQANKNIRRVYKQELRRMSQLTHGALETQAEMLDEEFDPHRRLAPFQINYLYKFT